jgi:glutamate synthase domain-containing protein 2
LAEIRRAAATGIYDIRGGGTKKKLPHFDDLLFLGASISRYPLEGYREKCDTSVVLGTRFAKKPIHLKTPITIAGMSFGALSGNAKEALGRGATIAGTSTTTGDGGMTDEERGHSQTLVYQYLPSRYGMNPKDLRRADAIEIVIGQGAKPGGGGMLLGQKISDRVANMRTLPKGIDQRSACRHPDWTGPDDLEIKINELREITDWESQSTSKSAAPVHITTPHSRLRPGQMSLCSTACRVALPLPRTSSSRTSACLSSPAFAQLFRLSRTSGCTVRFS